MAWILLEGLDRVGKSTIANLYKSKGFEVVHMSAPSKKYFEQGYAGESYLEELVRLYSKYEGKDVVFDRSPAGELIWPGIFGRESLLVEEDIDYLQQIENNNKVTRFLMYDENTAAHWQRCVDNNEPLNRQQFGRANILYNRLETDFGFKKRQLYDFPDITRPTETCVPERGNVDEVEKVSSHLGSDSTNLAPSKIMKEISLEDKLERANAIKELLNSRLIKKKGDVYDHLEDELRSFLTEELASIFAPKQDLSFDETEIQILKIYAKRIKDKMV